MSKDTLIRGTMILALATMVSKVLGFIYVVPFTAMVGVQGYILFEYAYKPYAIMISLATMGIPLAVSKFVAKYNEMGDYRMGRLMLKRGMILLSVTGIFWFITLYLSAPMIAKSLLGTNDGTGNTFDDVVLVIRMVSVALIIVPPMALLRGFFQGYQSMEPTGVSQVVEQLIRVGMILIGSFLILHVFNGSVATAVGFSTFAAFGGAVAGMWVLFRYWKKRKPELDALIANNKETEDIGFWGMFKELFSYAIPFVAVGLAIPLYQAADTFMINRALMGVSYTLQEAEEVNSIVSLVQKVILIPVALATAFGLSLVPAVTKSFANADKDTLHHQLKKTFQVIFYLTFPAVAGMMILSEEIFAMMFGTAHVELGSKLLLWYAPIALAYSFFTITAAMLQGMNKHRFAVVSLFIGLIVKLLVNVPMIQTFEATGTVISTIIGFSITILINLWVIRKQASFGYREVGKQGAMTLFFTGCMVVAIVLIGLLNPMVEQWIASNYLAYVIKGLIGVAVGGFVYVWATLQTDLFRQVFGQRFLFLDRLKWFNK